MNYITVLSNNQLYHIDLKEDDGTIRMVDQGTTYTIEKYPNGEYVLVNKDKWRLYAPMKTIGELLKQAAHDYPKAKFYNGNYPINVNN